MTAWMGWPLSGRSAPGFAERKEQREAQSDGQGERIETRRDAPIVGPAAFAISARPLSTTAIT